MAELQLSLQAATAGIVSGAEQAIRRLNAAAEHALVPLARLLLRTESIASSKVEGLQVEVRELALAESGAKTGRRVGPAALEVLTNIDAMWLAVDEASQAQVFTTGQITAIHAKLMAHLINAPRVAGVIRTTQNWIGGNDCTPCGADFVPQAPEHLMPLLDDLSDAINDDALPPLVQAAQVHAQVETIHPFADGNGRTGRALVQVVLRRRGVAPDCVPPISVVLAGAKERYTAGLTDFRTDRVEAWAEHFATAAGAAARLADVCIGRVRALVRALVEAWRSQLRAAVHVPRAEAPA